MIAVPAPLRLRLDGDALVANWRWLARQSGPAACGAAIKADSYGLGARAVLERLAAAGCRDFFVATWAEAAALMPLPPGVSLAVLHGVRAQDMPAALSLPARPVLNSVEQVARWRDAGDGRPCDIMVDTGMNRLGLAPEVLRQGILHGLTLNTLHSHLACADEDRPENAEQLRLFSALRAKIAPPRASLANSAGICLGRAYHFDLTRPGIALYGGVPRAEAARHIRRVVQPEAEILQVRDVPAGDTVGYGGDWRAARDSRIAIVNLGYADGYLRAHARHGGGRLHGVHAPLIGRVSMDLTAFDVSEVRAAREGDWIAIDYDLSASTAATGLSPYELLTGLGQRFERRWDD